jgi:hypothetical protein
MNLSMKLKPATLSLLTTIFWVAFIVVFVLILAGYAYRGIFSRYLQDDYCYSAQVMSRDFFSAQLDSYMRVMPYNSDRYSLTLFSGFAEVLGGSKFDPYLPVLSIVFWAAALWLVFREWHKAFQIKINPLASTVGAFSILVFTFYLAPNLYQVLFWRSAMFPYLTPLIINSFLVAAYFYIYRTRRINVLSAFLFGLTAFIAGGFSETVAIWQLCLWGLILIFFLFKSSKEPFAFKLILLPMLGTLLAILALALGPGNSDQLQPFQRPDLFTLVTRSFYYAWQFIKTSLRSLILPFFVIGCLGFLVGLRTGFDKKPTIAFTVMLVLRIAIFCYISIFSVMLPTMLAMSSYPGDRALLPAYFTLILSVFSLGWAAARFFISNQIWDENKIVFQAGAALLGILVLLYVARMAPTVYSNLSESQHRAEAWDMRDAMIRESAARGETHVVVPAFDSIAFILELYPNENFWVNSCAARYYGIEGISAIEGYNGVSPIFR